MHEKISNIPGGEAETIQVTVRSQLTPFRMAVAETKSSTAQDTRVGMDWSSPHTCAHCW